MSNQPDIVFNHIYNFNECLWLSAIIIKGLSTLYHLKLPFTPEINFIKLINNLSSKYYYFIFKENKRGYNK